MKWVYWPSLQKELEKNESHLNGRILNAGCGTRTITFTNGKAVINIDMQAADTVDIVADLESIPLEAKSIDGILCVAVLEHCKHPWNVLKEFNRITTDGARVVCAVPFFQPIHMVPDDFFRFTPNGLRSLFEEQGFKLITMEYTHSLFHILGWMCEDGLKRAPKTLQYLFAPCALACYLLTRFAPPINLGTAPCVLTIVAEKV